jgi:hypothetical protein
MRLEVEVPGALAVDMDKKNLRSHPDISNNSKCSTSNRINISNNNNLLTSNKIHILLRTIISINLPTNIKLSEASTEATSSSRTNSSQPTELVLRNSNETNITSVKEIDPLSRCTTLPEVTAI